MLLPSKNKQNNRKLSRLVVVIVAFWRVLNPNEPQYSTFESILYILTVFVWKNKIVVCTKQNTTIFTAFKTIFFVHKTCTTVSSSILFSYGWSQVVTRSTIVKIPQESLIFHWKISIHFFVSFFTKFTETFERNAPTFTFFEVFVEGLSSIHLASERDAC